MKLVKTTLLGALAVISSAISARADTYTFVDWNLQGLSSYKFLSEGQVYKGTWNISDELNWSSDLEVLGVMTDFWFADDGDSDTTTCWIKTGYWKEVKKKVWNSRKNCYEYVYVNEWVSTGGYYQTVDNPANMEEVDIKVGVLPGTNTGGELIFDNVEVDGYHSGVNLVTFDMLSADLTTHVNIVADISADGLLSYTVKAVKGDTYLKETRLTVIARDVPPPSVPDTGSTLGFLGVSLLGLLALRKRR